MEDGERPHPGGWNRLHFVTDDIAADVERLQAAGVTFRNPMVSGPGGAQILAQDPAGSLVELFQRASPAPRPRADGRRGGQRCPAAYAAPYPACPRP
jgi:catechol 2,3-dioxygenase-like lactoylglutathione lyase family enzyme